MKFIPRLAFTGMVALIFNGSLAWAEQRDLDLSNKTLMPWGGWTVPGQSVTQGDDVHHIKISFRPSENTDSRPETGVMLKGDIPESFTKVTVEALSNSDTDVRIRVADADGQPYIVRQPVSAGAWTTLEFFIDPATGNNWPPHYPFKSMGITAFMKEGIDEQTLELRNLKFD